MSDYAVLQDTLSDITTSEVKPESEQDYSSLNVRVISQEEEEEEEKEKKKAEHERNIEAESDQEAASKNADELIPAECTVSTTKALTIFSCDATESTNIVSSTWSDDCQPKQDKTNLIGDNRGADAELPVLGQFQSIEASTATGQADTGNEEAVLETNEEAYNAQDFSLTITSQQDPISSFTLSSGFITADTNQEASASAQRMPTDAGQSKKTTTTNRDLEATKLVPSLEPQCPQETVGASRTVISAVCQEVDRLDKEKQSKLASSQGGLSHRPKASLVCASISPKHVLKLAKVFAELNLSTRESSHSSERPFQRSSSPQTDVQPASIVPTEQTSQILAKQKLVDEATSSIDAKTSTVGELRKKYEDVALPDVSRLQPLDRIYPCRPDRCPDALTTVIPSSVVKGDSQERQLPVKREFFDSRTKDSNDICASREFGHSNSSTPPLPLPPPPQFIDEEEEEAFSVLKPASSCRSVWHQFGFGCPLLNPFDRSVHSPSANLFEPSNLGQPSSAQRPEAGGNTSLSESPRATNDRFTARLVHAAAPILSVHLPYRSRSLAINTESPRRGGRRTRSSVSPTVRSRALRRAQYSSTAYASVNSTAPSDQTSDSEAYEPADSSPLSSGNMATPGHQVCRQPRPAPLATGKSRSPTARLDFVSRYVADRCWPDGVYVRTGEVYQRLDDWQTRGPIGHWVTTYIPSPLLHADRRAGLEPSSAQTRAGRPALPLPPVPLGDFYPTPPVSRCHDLVECICRQEATWPPYRTQTLTRSSSGRLSPYLFAVGPSSPNERTRARVPSSPSSFALHRRAHFSPRHSLPVGVAKSTGRRRASLSPPTSRWGLRNRAPSASMTTGSPSPRPSCSPPPPYRTQSLTAWSAERSGRTPTGRRVRAARTVGTCVSPQVKTTSCGWPMSERGLVKGRNSLPSRPSCEACPREACQSSRLFCPAEVSSSTEALTVDLAAIQRSRDRHDWRRLASRIGHERRCFHEARGSWSPTPSPPRETRNDLEELTETEIRECVLRKDRLSPVRPILTWRDQQRSARAARSRFRGPAGLAGPSRRDVETMTWRTHEPVGLRCPDRRPELEDSSAGRVDASSIAQDFTAKKHFFEEMSKFNRLVPSCSFCPCCYHCPRESQRHGNRSPHPELAAGRLDHCAGGDECGGPSRGRPNCREPDARLSKPAVESFRPSGARAGLPRPVGWFDSETPRDVGYFTDSGAASAPGPGWSGLSAGPVATQPERPPRSGLELLPAVRNPTLSAGLHGPWPQQYALSSYICANNGPLLPPSVNYPPQTDSNNHLSNQQSRAAVSNSNLTPIERYFNEPLVAHSRQQSLQQHQHHHQHQHQHQQKQQYRCGPMPSVAPSPKPYVPFAQVASEWPPLPLREPDNITSLVSLNYGYPPIQKTCGSGYSTVSTAACCQGDSGTDLSPQGNAPRDRPFKRTTPYPLNCWPVRLEDVSHGNSRHSLSPPSRAQLIRSPLPGVPMEDFDTATSDRRLNQPISQRSSLRSTSPTHLPYLQTAMPTVDSSWEADKQLTFTSLRQQRHGLTNQEADLTHQHMSSVGSVRRLVRELNEKTADPGEMSATTASEKDGSSHHRLRRCHSDRFSYHAPNRLHPF